jgi:hypothetical protein
MRCEFRVRARGRVAVACDAVGGTARELCGVEFVRVPHRHRDPPRCGCLAYRPVAGADPAYGMENADFLLAELVT